MDYIQSVREAIAGKIWPITTREVQFKDYSEDDTNETHTTGLSFALFTEVLRMQLINVWNATVQSVVNIDVETLDGD